MRALVFPNLFFGYQADRKMTVPLNLRKHSFVSRVEDSSHWDLTPELTRT